MVYWRSATQSFVTISDNNVHEPHAIWAHLLPVIKFVKAIDPQIKKYTFSLMGRVANIGKKKFLPPELVYGKIEAGLNYVVVFGERPR